MTVATTTRKVQYTCDGVTTGFDFSFPIQEDEDIAVIVTDAAGVETALALTTNFEVSSESGTYESGGTITTLTYASGARATYAWADTYTITIYRSTSLLQETEFRNNRQFRQSSLETALDRVVMQIQDLNERMDRIVTVPVTDTADSLELPTAPARANKYLAFDADGNPIASAASADIAAVSAFVQTILDDTSAAAVRATIGAQEAGSYQPLTGYFVSNYATLGAAITAIGATVTTLYIDQPTTLAEDATAPATLSIECTKGGIITIANTKTLTINGPFSAGLDQVFILQGTGKVVFGDGSISGIRPEWWGALANNSTDCTSAFAQAIATAIVNRSLMRTKTLLLSDGVYLVTATSGNYAVTASCPMKGTGANDCVIKNVGAGSAMLVDAAYYSRFDGFSVVGTSSSEDGIVLGTYDVPPSYSQFNSIDSAWHGRDGLVINHAWGTKFFNCNFYHNLGLGVHLKPDDAHPGTKNAHVFRDCESRWNGGVTDNTGVYTKGGVLITNANGAHWLGGIVESNNAWGFIIGTDTASNSLIIIRDAYMEANPAAADEEGFPAVATTIGGCIYAAAKYERVEVSNCYMAYGGGLVSQTGYGFYVASSPQNSSYFKEWGNHVVSNGGPGSNQRDSGLYPDWTKSYISNALTAGVHDIYYIDEASNVSIGGLLYCQAPAGGENSGVYPFIGGYNTTGGSYINVGAKIAGAGSTAPSIAYDETDKVFQLTVGAGESVHIEMTVHGKQSNGAHVTPLLDGTVWNQDLCKRAN